MRVEIDDREVTDALSPLMKAGQQPAPVLNVLGQILKTRVTQGFVQGADPFGRPWQPLTSRSGRPLSNTGVLKNSISYRVEGDTVTVGTNWRYAATHQFGATIRARNKPFLRFMVNGHWVQVRQVKIPRGRCSRSMACRRYGVRTSPMRLRVFITMRSRGELMNVFAKARFNTSPPQTLANKDVAALISKLERAIADLRSMLAAILKLRAVAPKPHPCLDVIDVRAALVGTTVGSAADAESAFFTLGVDLEAQAGTTERLIRAAPNVSKELRQRHENQCLVLKELLQRGREALSQ